MLEDLVIIVGKGHCGQEEIVEALSDKGYQTEKTINCIWPRDDYVLHNGVYTKSWNTDGSYNPLGEGGNLRFGDGFVLFSDYAAWLEFGNSEEALVKLKETFLGMRPYLVPTGYPEIIPKGEHIDLFTLVCPKQKLLFLDWGIENAVRKRVYSEIAEREGLKVIYYDYEEVALPLNAAILPGENGTDIVLLDRACIPLMRMLRNNGVEVIPVDFPKIKHPNGKLNCQVNHYYKSDDITILDLLRKV